MGLLAVVAGVFLFFRPAGAECSPLTPVGCVQGIIGAILQALIWVIGSLLFLVMRLLLMVAQYNNFVDSPTVNLGWAIIRDLTNMFFVLMMLIVAFGTILGVEQFSWRSILPKLFIMAVLINFSKVIVGFLIDFSQVVMMTFVNGFAAAAGANMTNLLGLTDLTKLSDTAGAIGGWDIIGGLFLATVMFGLSLAAVIIFTAMLVMRIVMLWILTILSPAAFFLSTFPRGKAQQAYSEWWSKLGNYLVAGPVLAFFLWLSFAAAGSGDIATREGIKDLPAAGSSAEQERVSKLSQAGSPTVGSQPINFASTVIGLALLMGGMMITSQFGTLGGQGLAGAAKWVQDRGANFAKKTAFAPLKVGAFLAKDAESRLKATTGIGLDPRRYVSAFKTGYRSRFEAREKRSAEAAETAAAKGGWQKYPRLLLGAPEKFAREYGLAKGVGGLAASPFAAAAVGGAAILSKFTGKQYLPGIAPREVVTYSQKAEDAKAKRTIAESEVTEAQATMNTYERQQGIVAAGPPPTATLKKDEIAAIEAELNARKTGTAPRDLAEEAAMERTINAGRANQEIKMDDLGKAGAAGAALKSGRETEFKAAQSFVQNQANAFEYQAAKLTVQDPGRQKAIGESKKEEEFYREKARTAQVRGMPEIPKEGMNTDLVQDMVEKAATEKNSKAVVELVMKAVDDGSLGDLMGKYDRRDEGGNVIGKFGTSSGDLVDFMKQVVQPKAGMDTQEGLGLLERVSNRFKGQNPEFANLTRRGAGGVVYLNDAETQKKASANDMERNKEEQVSKGKDLLAHQDGKGTSVPNNEVGTAWLSRFSDILARRLADRPDSVNPKLLQDLIQHQGDFRGRLEKMVGAGTADKAKLDQFNEAVRLATAQIGKIPKKLGDVVSDVAAAAAPPHP